MTVINLKQTQKKAIAGLVCLGWEEVRAHIEAAEQTGAAAVLMVGPNARAAMPLEIWGAMLRLAAERSSASLVLHLDHARTLDDVQRALDAGFSSVMYDGSMLPLEQNIKQTRQVVERAQAYGASSEGEIGYVGYENGVQSLGTEPEQATIFARETGIDMMAVSVGNVHLQTQSQARIDWQRLAQLAQINIPLVIHGGSGVASSDRLRMARDYNVRKFNIGTEIRQVFGKALRARISEDDCFDHPTLLKATHAPMRDAAIKILRELEQA